MHICAFVSYNIHSGGTEFKQFTDEVTITDDRLLMDIIVMRVDSDSRKCSANMIMASRTVINHTHHG